MRRGKCRALSLCLRRVVWSHVRVCRRGTPPVHPRKLPVSRDGGLSAILRASARRRSAKKRVRRVARPAGAFFYQGPRLCVAVRDNATDTELASSHRRCSRALRRPATQITLAARHSRGLAHSRTRPFEPQTPTVHNMPPADRRHAHAARAGSRAGSPRHS